MREAELNQLIKRIDKILNGKGFLTIEVGEYTPLKRDTNGEYLNNFFVSKKRIVKRENDVIIDENNNKFNIDSRDIMKFIF